MSRNSATMSIATPRQGSFLERPQSKTGVALPMIKVPHPASRMDNPANINVRGVSRQSSNHFVDDFQMKTASVLRPITADQIPFRNLKSQRNRSLPPLGEDIDVRLAEERNRNASNQGLNSQSPSPGGSRPATSTTVATGRAPTDELERSLKEKMKTGYYTMKNAFKMSDPEGKGNVSRESLLKIISDFLAVLMSLSQFNRLMTRLNLEKKKIISFEEFYACFKPQIDENGEYPSWFESSKRGNESMTAPQVFMHLKEKAKQRVLEMASIIPQKNPGGTRRVLKPEFRNAMGSLGFRMSDEEFEKLWARFDNENIGAVSGERIMTKLGIALSDDQRSRTTRSSSRSRRSASPQDFEEEKRGIDLTNWMTSKFREGAREMMHAFYEMDLERSGMVSKLQLNRVLSEYCIDLDEEQLKELLERCGLPTSGPIDYKKFIHKFQDRSEIGMTHKILNDREHAYNNEMEKGSGIKDTYAAESKLMDLFQREFLSLLGSFSKIDRDNAMVIAEKQFRAIIESRFRIELGDDSFKKLMKKVPVDENGMVKYVEFMGKFDSREAKSLFDAKSTVADLRDVQDIQEDILPPTQKAEDWTPRGQTRGQSHDSYDSREGRSVQELNEVIKNAVKDNYQGIELEFRNLDEFNTKKLNREMLVRLLKKFGVDLSRNEVKRLWDTMITDHKGYLEFMQFVRHFTFSLKTAAFPNSKVSPPKRGDSDFQLRSKKLNSAYDMLEDSLRSRVDQNWDALHRHFHEIDPSKTGFVSREKFKHVLQSLCIRLADIECDLLSNRFDVKKDGSVCWVEFLKPFSWKRQVYRRGNNIANILTHPQDDQMKPTPHAAKGFGSVALKVKNRFAGDVRQLQRAFKKLDTSNSGYSSIQEFTLVLRLCDVDLDEEESFQLFTDLDKSMNGRVNYNEFISKLSST